jgi:hypothetical protein
MRIFGSEVIGGKVCRRKLPEIIAGLPKHKSFLWPMLRETAQLKQKIFGRRFQIKDFRVGDCQEVSVTMLQHRIFSYKLCTEKSPRMFSLKQTSHVWIFFVKSIKNS